MFNDLWIIPTMGKLAEIIAANRQNDLQYEQKLTSWAQPTHKHIN